MEHSSYSEDSESQRIRCSLSGAHCREEHTAREGGGSVWQDFGCFGSQRGPRLFLAVIAILETKIERLTVIGSMMLEEKNGIGKL
jgi:hypothetical protein